MRNLATELLKVYKKLSPARIADLFRIRQNNYSYFATLMSNHGIMCIMVRKVCQFLWNLVPNKLRQLVDGYAFKKKIKNVKAKTLYMQAV